MTKDQKLEELRNDILEGKARRSDLGDPEDGYDIKSAFLGYFGTVGIISVGGKKTVVFCDPRDMIIKPMLNSWYDDVVSTRGTAECLCPWDTDTRFQSNPNRHPVLVKKDGKWAMIGWNGPCVYENGFRKRMPYRDAWYDTICRTTVRMPVADSSMYVYPASLGGRTVYLTWNGFEVDLDIDKTYSQVKDITDKKWIRDNWIKAGKPCTHIRGFEWKGARPGLLNSVEAALNLLDKSSFGKSYDSMEWTTFNGSVALQFATYSEGDME